MQITVGGEMISVLNQFDAANPGRGIERIAFADGVVWTVEDILTRTRLNGTVQNNTLTGTALMDNIFGLAGDDTITGGAGDDLIVGGPGADDLDGDAGNDRFEWSLGDGADIIRDTAASLTDVDTLALLDVGSAGVTLDKSGNNLLVVIGGTTLTVIDRFDQTQIGRGVEVIEYADGVITRILNHPVAVLHTTGTGGANTFTGWAFRDLIEGLGGNDTLIGNGGDDTLVGGAGQDSLVGGAGSDTYRWSRGDGNDMINDAATSQTDIDVLHLTDVAAADVQLTRTSGLNDLVVTVTTSGTPETLTVKDRFLSATEGRGIETILFEDGSAWTLDEILARTETRGTTGNDSLSGTGYADNLFGGNGADTLVGAGDDDLLVGGAGADSLNGQAGNDRYLWLRGDGADTINDTSTSLTESDTLILGDVLPAEVTLTRATGSLNHLLVTIAGTGGATITVLNRYGASLSGTGIERIEFADGTVWSLDDIEALTTVTGTSGNNNISGSARRDNLFGEAGQDTLAGGAGNDWLVGGTGNDSLVGGAGSDTYVWTLGDGNDTINDNSSSLAEIDTLRLIGVSSSDVSLTRASGGSAGNHLLVNITTPGGTQIVTVLNQLYSTSEGWGIERILFDDGTDWNLQEIHERIVTWGTSGADDLYGSDFGDHLASGPGNDRLYGGNGNDVFNGAQGADSLYGGQGVDTANYNNVAQGVSVDLRIVGAQPGIAGGVEVGDVLSSIENLLGSVHADTLIGDDGANIIDGHDGNDMIEGNGGYDILRGGNGQDTLYGGNGADYLRGQGGADTLYGGDGNDTLDGDADGDRLYGGDGDDLIYGDAGNDTLTGGAGADLFVFRGIQFATDEVTDFEVGSSGQVIDRIDLSEVSAIADYEDLVASHMSQVGADVRITIGGSNTIYLRGIAMSSLTEDHFVF